MTRTTKGRTDIPVRPEPCKPPCFRSFRTFRILLNGLELTFVVDGQECPSYGTGRTDIPVRQEPCKPPCFRTFRTLKIQ
jgi:hypothetical protein